VLTGIGGSGTVFLAGCNLGCAFCQNQDLRKPSGGRCLQPSDLADIFLALQAQGCRNINLVTPTPSIPALVEGISLAAQRGLDLPLVFNTSSYDSRETLALLDGVVDIYLADFKTDSPVLAEQWMNAPDYPEVARTAIVEMHRQVGLLEIDKHGAAIRGLLVRHLVMPGCIEDSSAIVSFLVSVSPGIAINVMDQYRPLAEASLLPGLSRRPTAGEIRAVRDLACSAGLRMIGS
jgi:putative pyruvate formate lyase activating enzyme